jgi:leucyl aminopeptidase
MIRETSVRLRRADDEQLGEDAEQVVVFTCPGDRLDPASARMLERSGVAPAELEASGLLPARVRQAVTGPLLGGARPRRLVLVCLDPEAADPVAALRDAAATAGRHAQGAGPIAVALPTSTAGRPDAAEALVEGLVLGRHRFERYRSNAVARPPVLDLVVVADAPEDELRAEARRGAIVADAANWARDLATTAPADKTPAVLAEELREVVTAAGGSVRIWSERELEAAGFRGVLAVASGSPARPAMVEIDLRGADGGAHVALAGKGVTFDSGGLDLKPLESMYTMKHDMGGAAAVAAAIYAAGRLALPVDVHAVLPLVENMPSGTALRPGDVIEHWNGMTSEVVSPDAEGRLILADAISYLSTRTPQSLVAVSTLTGATAVGADLWGVFSDAPGLAAELVDAGRRAGEPGWALPLWRPYRSHLDSNVADLRNTSERLTYSVAGIVGSLFLGEFVPPSLPWAHIDIAATVARTALTANEVWPAGATGSPARALVRWLETTGAAA